MLCDNCNIELRLDKYENNIFIFKCIKCGQILQKTKEELEQEYKKFIKETE